MGEAFDGFYRGKRVLLTGHTGFKGAWMCALLIHAGADVIGYAQEPPTAPNLFTLLGVEKDIVSVMGDVRCLEPLAEVVKTHKPDIVFHMAAQPIVRRGYAEPAYTYETNVMGTVNVLEAVRTSATVRSFVNVTTDKVYDNREWAWGYRETDALGGQDPYASSKACSELITQAFRHAFLDGRGIAVSTCRSGNVIGGGDFAQDRIIPDCARAIDAGRDVVIRNPYSVRPYQHVLDTLSAYLLVARGQYDHPEVADCYNIGPDEGDCVTTGVLADLFCGCFEGARWVSGAEKDAPHESRLLRLDCSRIKARLGWRPVWDIRTAVRKTADMYRTIGAGGDPRAAVRAQIGDFLADRGRTL